MPPKRGTKEHTIWRKNLSKARRGKKLHPKFKKSFSNSRWNKGKHGVQDYSFLKGEKHPNWKGGISSLNLRLRSSFKYLYWKQEVFIRDNFTCKKCDKRGGCLHAHHKIKFATLIQEAIKALPLFDKHTACMMYIPLWETSNGITHCRKCHRKVKH